MAGGVGKVRREKKTWCVPDPLHHRAPSRAACLNRWRVRNGDSPVILEVLNKALQLLLVVVEITSAVQFREVHLLRLHIRHLEGPRGSFSRRAVDCDALQLLLDDTLHRGEAGIVPSSTTVLNVDLHRFPSSLLTRLLLYF